MLGAKVVRVKQNREEFMHLNEIEIYDENGGNVASNGRCFSFSTGYGGDPNCLNDGLTGTLQDTCHSHASWYNVNNYDYCVLDSATTISRIIIYPILDPTRTWLTGRLNDIQLSVFADVSGESGSAQFIGELYTERLLNVFTSSQTDPRDFNGKFKSKCIIWQYKLSKNILLPLLALSLISDPTDNDDLSQHKRKSLKELIISQ